MFKVKLDKVDNTKVVMIDDCFQFAVYLEDSEELRNLSKVIAINTLMNEDKETKVIINEYFERGLNLESLSDERFNKDVINPLIEMTQGIDRELEELLSTFLVKENGGNK